MRLTFGSWKYIFRNIWYVLPFALVPAVFLALSVDHAAVYALTEGFFTGEPRIDFVMCLRALSFLRLDSWLGAVYSVCAFIIVPTFLAFLLAFVEKHLRIGKRTLSGVVDQFMFILPATVAVAFFYLVLYEAWAVVLSAILYVISALRMTAFVYILYVFAFLVLGGALLYLSTVGYMFLPCKLVTGFRPYDAFVYGYRVMMRVRWRLILSLAVSYVPMIFILAGASFLPGYLYRIVSVVLFAFLFADFTVRMATVYFDADKLDREDILKSYREL